TSFTGCTGGSGFTLHTNDMVQPAPGAHDWDQVFNPGSFSSAGAQQTVFLNDSGAANNGGTDSTAFTPTNLNKDISPISTGWQWTNPTNIASNLDLLDGFASAYVNPTDNHLMVYFGGDRDANSGSASIGFWLFQDSISATTPGNFTATTGHTTG